MDGHKTLTKSRAATVILALAVALLLASCGGDSPGQPSGAEYVALGDSFTAGTEIEPQTDEFVPAGCSQSSVNYPHLLEKSGDVGELVDASCTGATMADLIADQTTDDGTNGPQLDRLTDSAKLVTISLGGNDAGFGRLLESCGQPEGECVPELAKDSEFLAGPRTVRANLERALAEVKRRSPDAEILVIGYPRILPRDFSGCEAAVPISEREAMFINTWMQSLNDSMANAADTADATFVDMSKVSADHTACAPPGERWIEPAVGADGAIIHPNAAGHEAIARAIEQTLGQN